MRQNNGLVINQHIYVAGPRLASLQSWERHNVNVTTSTVDVVQKCDIVFICVKPHLLQEALKDVREELNGKIDSNKLWVSVLAGTTIQTLLHALNFCKNPKIIRTMPNTPVQVGSGCIVYAAGPGVTIEQQTMIETLLKAVGVCRSVPEKLINAIGGLAGSGPAFIYLMIEALADGGVKMGIPRDVALSFAAQTALGAAKMVLETAKHPGQLKDDVCSPGGSTIAGIHELEKAGVRSAFMSAVEAATLKSELMGKMNEK